ncbi:hypothetical protein [Micrococcus luteus]|uniref:hypothetical protein n=1 Tax=Micrococcus luteus TaxID=1270 RepID=UPI003319BFF7
MSTLPTIPPDPSDWDWMEIVVFDAAIEHDGYEYAFDHYTPLFRRPELRALAADMGGLRAFMRAHDDAREAWFDELGWEAYGKLYDAHLKEHQQELDRRRTETATVSDRPDVADHASLRGPRFSLDDDADRPHCVQTDGWFVFATNHIVFGGSGHISWAEARRMAAALHALADQHDPQGGAL